jgi:hypothetical protein
MAVIEVEMHQLRATLSLFVSCDLVRHYYPAVKVLP